MIQQHFLRGPPRTYHEVEQELEVYRKRLTHLMDIPSVYAAEVTDELYRLYQEGKVNHIYKVWPLGRNVKPQEGGYFPAWFTSNPLKNVFVVCTGNSRLGERHTREEIDAWINMLANHNPH